MKRFNYAGATGLALLVAIGGVTVLDRTIEAQTGAPVYHNVPLWPRPFADDSWVVGSVTGVATDAQNNVWVAHRGNESLEANERGLIPVPGGQGQVSSASAAWQPVHPQSIHPEADRQLGRRERRDSGHRRTAASPSIQGQCLDTAAVRANQILRGSRQGGPPGADGGAAAARRHHRLRSAAPS